VPLDRVAALRNAEKLLRQGKLEPAIAEYLRIVEDQPRDLNSTNTLGDLYVRAGQVDKAVEQFIRIATILNDDGFRSKAGALYKKILKLKPDHEHALLQAAEIAATQGLLVDARMYFKTVADRRRARGDTRGAAQAMIRLGTLDPADFKARMAAAASRVEIGETSGAVDDLKAIAAQLSEDNRQAEAIEALRQAALIAPEDEGIREHLMNVYLAAGDLAHARECAVTAQHFKSLAAALDQVGSTDEALGMLREAARLDPADAELREHLARTFVTNGNMAAASEFLTAETAGQDPKLQLMAAELRLRGAKVDEGLAIIRLLLEQDPARRDDVAALGWNLADESPEAAFMVVELAAQTAVVQTDWASAAAALQEFLTRVPNHIKALMRLVEICVDGGLEATMYEAQAQLADAYIAAGMGSEACFIAEDLVAREPWERANIERFRRSLVLLGEQDPDGVIADRLSGQSPFMSTDVITRAAFPALDEPVSPENSRATLESDSGGIFEDDALDLASLTGLNAAPPPAINAEPRVPRAATDAEASSFDLSADVIDMNALFADSDGPSAVSGGKPKAHAAQESVEVDLSVVLGDMTLEDVDIQPRAAAQSAQLHEGSLDDVFERLRDETSKRTGGDNGDEQLSRGMSLRQAGKIDESIQAFELASRSPRHRFQAATLLGRTHRGRGHMPAAIEWFERAAQAPAPSEEEGHMLMYELADALESAGEVARALAICIELQAHAPEFRDVGTRVERLAKVQTRG
jgi:tetratricopeptide (TPR) repeat protein